MLLLVLAGACSLEERGAPGTNANAEVVVGDHAQGDSVEVILSAPSFARVGDAVPISVVVRNNSTRPIDLHLTGRDIAFDIIIERADSSIVWRRLAGTAVQQILQLKPLAPDESFTLSDHWSASETGEYRVRAQLPTDAAPLVAEPVRLVIR